MAHGTPVRPPLLPLLLLAATLAGCAKERGRPPVLSCEAYDPDLAPLLDQRCGACHSGDAPAGSYALDSYLGLLGPGTDDTANAIAGDPMSLLLTVLDPATADADHQGFADVLARLSPWVVSCELRYSDSPIHAAGIMNPASSDFHGQLVREATYDFDTCRRCHGEDFGGGIADAPCTPCHADGPTQCDTCHRQDLLDVGAHGAHVHLVGPMLRFTDCQNCHVTPTNYRDVGHVLLADGSLDDYPAEVELGGLANVDPPGGDRTGPPSYDATTGTCAQVYCHGDVFPDTSATLTKPVWTGTDQATCGSCHGIPPDTHASDVCETCHQRVIGPGRVFIAPELHVDGYTDIGRHGDTCDSCHGAQGGPISPPLDLTGGSSTSLVTVGAHASHVLGTHGVAVPLTCADCHLMPTSLHAPGHIDTPPPAEVFPGAPFVGLASADGATPTWDPVSGTCSGVYCHGGGAKLGPASDTSPGVLRTIDFAYVDQSMLYCGSCHGVPPSFSPHDPTMTVFDCSGCHSQTVDAFGGILISGPPDARTSHHMNGSLD